MIGPMSSHATICVDNMFQHVCSIIVCSPLMKQQVGDFAFHYKSWRYGRVVKCEDLYHWGMRIEVAFAYENYDYKLGKWYKDGLMRNKI